MPHKFKPGDLIRFCPLDRLTWDVAMVIDRACRLTSRDAMVEYYILHEGIQKAVWDGYLKLIHSTRTGIKSDSRG